MPVTGVKKTKADLLTEINSDIMNSPATLIRGDVLAQKLADIEESAVNIKSAADAAEVLKLLPGYNAANVQLLMNNAGTIQWIDQ